MTDARAVLEVACAAEGSYVPHSAAMIHSLLTGPRSYDVHVNYMHGPEFSQRSLRKLQGMVDGLGGSIRFLEVPDERCDGLPTKGFTRKATWYRVLLPELLPDSERVLYLDADLLVLRSLEELWATELSDHYVAAVTNVLEPQFADRPTQLGLSGPGAYFNAGVLLLDLAKMRADGCTEAILNLGRERAGDLLWRDQDALNIILGPNRLALHPRWNCMNSVLLFPWSADVFGEEAVAEAKRSPAIRHFEGPSINKPWHLLSEREAGDLYFVHRRETPWPRVRREGVTPPNVLKRIARRRDPNSQGV